MTTATPVTAPADAQAALEAPRARRNLLGLIVVLFKLRVVALLLFAALGGAMLGSDGAPAWGALSLLMLTGTLSAGGASALNQVFERHKDGAMKRTRRRPLVTGEANPAVIAVIALGMVFGASALAWAAGNLALAAWLAIGAAIYVGVYTLWLKPRSALNVVIGGAAGSAAVISGGAAVGAWTDAGVWLLAGLLCTWSPMHFWSLALAYRTDYARARVPMLPVIATPRTAIFWMLVHALATAAFGLLLGAILGWLYLAPVLLATLWLLGESARLIRDYSGARALSVFKVSNLYLALVLLAIVLATLA